MPLEQIQQSMAAAIRGGPDFVEPSAFVGGRVAALRGLAVHANTISHARLVALEDTFPRTRARLGCEDFNLISRQFVETPQATRQSLSMIGRHFPECIADHARAADARLAAFEWAWLESYHAAEAVALALSDLAGLSQEELLALEVGLHPACRMVEPVDDAELAREIPGLADCAAILISRPHAEVRVAAADREMAQFFALLKKPTTVCNLLLSGAELVGEDSLQPMLALLEAGSLVLAKQGA